MIWAFWFFLPGGIANMSPVFANKIPGFNQWKTPVDLGKSWRGKRIFGENKTWRGLVFGILMGAVIGWLVRTFVYYHVPWPADLMPPGPVIGATMGAGALLGDTIESFFKRHAGILPGKSWFPFDQIDYIIGGLLLSYPLARTPLNVMLVVVALYFGLHLVTAYIGFLLGLKDKPI